MAIQIGLPKGIHDSKCSLWRHCSAIAVETCDFGRNEKEG